MAPRANKFGISCKDCGITITPENGYWNNTSGSLLNRCNVCYKIYNSNRNIEQKKFKQFGITQEDYQQRKNLQLNGCAICKQEVKGDRDLHIDHNHITNEVRDLLCANCNMVLGLVYENEDILINMIEYLKKHNQKIA